MEPIQCLKPSLQKRQKRRYKRLGEEVIECYRAGTRSKKMKGYDKKYLRQDLEDSHKHEGIKFMHGGGTKYFNDNLAPLKRFLLSQVGKNWDKTYSKLCTQLDRKTVSGLHVFNHLFDYVHVKTTIENKVIYYYSLGRKYVLTSSKWIPRFYVDHKTGQLRKAPEYYKQEKKNKMSD